MTKSSFFTEALRLQLLSENAIIHNSKFIGERADEKWIQQPLKERKSQLSAPAEKLSLFKKWIKQRYFCKFTKR